jgi:hypothetical protein
MIKEKIANLINSSLNKVQFQPIRNGLRMTLYNMLRNDAKRNYIQSLAKNTQYDTDVLKELFYKFDKINHNIQCAHGEFEFYIMYAMILELLIEGPIIELGCFKGGSTAKLSLLSELTGRKLYAFDSFEGLPIPGPEDIEHDLIPWIYYKETVEYNEGTYIGTLDEVKSNVAKYGCIDVCEFRKGYFQETLPNFKVNPACIFIDVDYIESARVVLKHLWPKLLPGGIFFTHETLSINFIEAITNSIWWESELNERPPLLYGAGYGTCWRWGHFTFPSNIAYFKKSNKV